MIDAVTKGCQYIGPEQREWPFTMCGHATITGKQYCGEHYYKVYQKGTAIAGKKKEKIIEQEIEELKRLQEMEELENIE
jgi:hypothetical protein